MSRYRTNLAVQVEPDEAEDDEDTAANNNNEDGGSALNADCPGDHVGVPSRPCLMKILQKQGDTNLVFADKVLKFTSSGKMKRRILLITDFAIYIVDPETDVLKRRIAMAAVEKLCLSKLNDNFFAIVIPTEYDILMASTRKTEIVTCIVDTTRTVSNYELDVFHSNRFEYNATAEVVKQVKFEEIEGGVKTRILQSATQHKE